MGWNTGYTIFEATVIGAYDLGKLDKEMLDVLMKPYRGSDIDSGGRTDLETRDGKGVEQVVIETLGLPMPQKPAKDADDFAREEYHDKVGDIFYNLTRKHYGWS